MARFDAVLAEYAKNPDVTRTRLYIEMMEDVFAGEEGTDLIAACARIMHFYAHESCGQCTPCREGTAWALRMLTRIKAGRGRIKDLDLLLEIGDSIGIIPGTTICGLSDGAAWPIKNVIRKFRDEFEETIKRTNPDGYMETDPVPAMELVELN